MNKLLLFLMILLLNNSLLFSQIGINNDGSAPASSAMLDVNSSNLGVLLPRIVLASANDASPVTSPAIGLLIYNTANSGIGPNRVCPGIYQWNGLRWVRLNDGLNCGYALLPNNCFGGGNNPCNPYSTVTDIDGNIYGTIIIGLQEWMAENLKVTKYLNNDPITYVPNETVWGGLSTEAYCWHDNLNADFITYGALYNWYAVNDSRGLCPAGWHVPSDAEWSILTSYLGGVNVAGDKIKECGTAHWWSPNASATNETCFSALPGGMRDLNGVFGINEAEGFWWSSTQYNSSNAHYRSMYYDWGGVYVDWAIYRYGFSVRCVKN
jgi:uncharacterized protein (TIGR02145 family)